MLPMRLLLGVLSGWTPTKLFAGGTAGGWWDAGDLSTLFQDTAGTTPVTALAQPVRRISDKSGNGKHITFSGTNPPLYGVTSAGYPCLVGSDSTSRGLNAGFTMSQPYSAVTVVDTTLQGGTARQNVIFDSYDNNGLSFISVQPPGTSGTKIVIASQVVGLVQDNFTPLGRTTIYGVSSATVGELAINGVDKLSGNSGVNGLSGLSLFDIAGNPNPAFTPYNSLLPFFRLVIVAGKLSASDKALLQSWATSLSKASATRNSYGVLGDSTITAYLAQNAVASYLPYSKTLISTATPGDTIANQRTKWNALNGALKMSMAAVFAQIGLNDLTPGESAATALGRLQSLVTAIRADIPASSPILIGTMTPCRQRLIDVYGGVDGPTSYAKWLAMNDAIAGNGGSAITGVEYRATAHTATLNDGSGNLASGYEISGTNDHIHENNAGRQIVANSWAALLPTI